MRAVVVALRGNHGAGGPRAGGASQSPGRLFVEQAPRLLRNASQIPGPRAGADANRQPAASANGPYGAGEAWFLFRARRHALG